MSDPEVSIIVIAHSVRGELQRCFASVRRHADVPVEVILVDNASTDDTRTWVRAEHPDVRLVPLESNLGAAARDEALPLARGTYTMFLDSDTVLRPGSLRTLVSALEGHAGWGLVAPRLVYDDERLQLSCRRFPPRLLPLLRRPPLARFFEDSAPVRHHLMADDDHSHTRPVLYVIGACQLFRTSLARELGGFDRRTFLGWSDADWCLRVWDAGAEVVYVPEATVVHSYRQLTRNHPVSRAAWRQLASHVRFQWKYRRTRRALLALQEQLDRRASYAEPVMGAAR